MNGAHSKGGRSSWIIAICADRSASDAACPAFSPEYRATINSAVAASSTRQRLHNTPRLPA